MNATSDPPTKSSAIEVAEFEEDDNEDDEVATEMLLLI
jgi:hypothetical protein